MNNKTRKLNYIRSKNDIRTGKRKFTTFTKVSNYVLNDTKLGEEALNDIIETNKKELKRKFNLELQKVDIEIGMDGMDFVKDMKTIKIVLSK